MDFKRSVKTCLTEKYATFQGRASRSEYWWFVLAYFIGMVVVSLFSLGMGFLISLFWLALIVPLTAAGFRRLQDTGRPGTWILLPVGLSVLSYLLMPDRMMGPGDMMAEPGQMHDYGGMGRIGLSALLGVVQFIVAIVFLWFLTRPSEPETNAYGPPPAT